MQPAGGLADCSAVSMKTEELRVNPCHGHGNVGGGSLGSGGWNEQQGIPHCKAFWVELCYRETGRAP